MSEVTIDYELYTQLVVDARKWRAHVANEELRRKQAVASLYDEGALVAQGTERPASNREDAGSSPAQGVTNRVAQVAAGFDGPGRRMARRNNQL